MATTGGVAPERAQAGEVGRPIDPQHHVRTSVRSYWWALEKGRRPPLPLGQPLRLPGWPSLECGGRRRFFLFFFVLVRKERKDQSGGDRRTPKKDLRCKRPAIS